MSFGLGMDAVLYYKEGGVGGGGSFVELTNARDVTLNMEAGEADVTTRGNNGWEAVVATLKKASIDFEMVWDTADAGFGVIRDAFLNNSVVGMRVLDKAYADSGQGLEADMMVTGFTRNEPIDEAITVSVTMKVCYSTTAPVWVNA